ncbi:hypothetical protein GAYE_SCF56G6385 [Galdieria yellowstonensis]|uniref:MARVEL domain-containing protein n=1 Tax=Galdieria yellowstonensis TaxID=3028027 RepID=A0AAV9ILU6_9RHOD|nr:hypothetical protein GAYE_SCF56G6385 [Galdieria yellowstonensis]
MYSYPQSNSVIPGTRQDSRIQYAPASIPVAARNPAYVGPNNDPYGYHTSWGANVANVPPSSVPPSTSAFQTSTSQTRRKHFAIFGWVYSKYGNTSWFSTTKVIYGFAVALLIIGVALIEAADIRFLYVSSLKEKADLATGRFIAWIIYFLGEVCFYIDYVWFVSYIESEPETRGTHIVLWLLVALGALALALTAYSIYRAYHTMKQAKKDASLQERIYSSANM